MSKKFSLSEGMLNGISKNIEKANTLEAKNNFKVEYIDIKDIKRNEKNFYEIVNVDELAEDIKMNGLNHNLVVRKLEDGTYELISGERRYTALNKLVQEGNNLFALVPCKVIEANDIDAEIILIQANAQTRELSDLEKLEQVKRLTELYKTKKANGEKIPGRVRNLIANDLNLSATQVSRYESINNNLIPELKEILESGNLTIANASEFSTLSEDNQKVILDIINSKVELNKKEAIDLKNKLKEIEEEKERELKSRQSIIEENARLKAKINENNVKSEEEIKQIEGQLRIEVKQELNNKYGCIIEEVKNQAKASNEEKERYKKELEELKAKTKAKDENSEELKENYKLISELRNVHTSLVALMRQHDKMKRNNINFSQDILDELRRVNSAKSILSNLSDEIK
ncbi:MAG: ParB/RepB/Spo0J family partition protein [Clostridium sp.]|uniref:ParB/RepB/Spo0J family partition protein n=1 Tax=Clostridium sp. TaxID=1506 RepID=UPI0028FE1F9E|nr:ParB/RepB/Spo0J family partition protein [Clostridium sp.]MDU2674002.1 ParB/RepB/Spo0J family partition protein [Clostridium sp.]MDU2680280.1 ParB/RepB/Spo0J family partition protein [Clostridium sp.]